MTEIPPELWGVLGWQLIGRFDFVPGPISAGATKDVSVYHGLDLAATQQLIVVGHLVGEPTVPWVVNETASTPNTLVVKFRNLGNVTQTSSLRAAVLLAPSA